MDTPVDPPRRWVDPPDELQVRVIMRVPPEQRIRNLLTMQDTLLQMWRNRLRRAYPHLSDLALTRLVYERLGQNG